MEAIRLKEYITDRELIIDNEKIKQFHNMEVEIIILPLLEKPAEKNFMKFAGVLTAEDGIRMLNDLEDCRKIDQADWE